MRIERVVFEASWVSTGFQAAVSVDLPEDFDDGMLQKIAITHAGTGSLSGTMYLSETDPGGAVPGRLTEVVTETLTTMAAAGTSSYYAFGVRPFALRPAAGVRPKLWMSATLSANSGTKPVTVVAWILRP